MAAGAVESCEKSYLNLEKEVDEVIDRYVSAAEEGQGYYRAIGKIEFQLALAQKMQASGTDLDLNETVVIAEKAEAEIAEAEKMAMGAMLSDREADWSDELEAAREAIDSLSHCMRKMKSASENGEAMDVRSAILAFRRHSKNAKERIARLRSFLSTRKHPAYAKLFAAKKKALAIKAGVGKAFERLSKERLRKKVGEAKEEISQFLKKTESGRIFVDHKHLSIYAPGRVERLPLTQAVRFALAEMAPIESQMGKLGKGGFVLTGEYKRHGSGMLLTLGERSVAGDMIIYREKAYRLS